MKHDLFLHEPAFSSYNLGTRPALLGLTRHLAPKRTLVAVFFFVWLLSTACVSQPSPQSEFDVPFTLQLEQTISLPESKATISFVEVLQDARCPTRVECETHGPVLVSLVFQQP